MCPDADEHETDGLVPFLHELCSSHQFLCQSPSGVERRALWQYAADTDLVRPPPRPRLPRSEWPVLNKDPNPPPRPQHTIVAEDVEQRKRHEDACIRQMRVFVRDSLLRCCS